MSKFTEFLEAISPSIKRENTANGRSGQLMLDELDWAGKLGIRSASQALSVICRLNLLSSETQEKIIKEISEKIDDFKKM